MNNRMHDFTLRGTPNHNLRVYNPGYPGEQRELLQTPSSAGFQIQIDSTPKPDTLKKVPWSRDSQDF